MYCEMQRRASGQSAATPAHCGLMMNSIRRIFIVWIQLQSRSRQAFTLIELLVVIAIISILAALLMPAVGSALDKSKSVMCQSNLRQAAIGMTQYADDHDGVMPAYWDNPTHDRFGAVIHWQFTIGVDYMNENRDTFSVPEAIRRSALHCPADTAISIPALGGRPTRCVAINGTMNPRLEKFNGRSWPQPSGATMAPLALVARPSDMCMAGDGAGADYSNEWGNAARYYDINVGNLYMFIRHMGGLNVVMMDGHTIWMSPDDFEEIVSGQGYDGVFFDWAGLHP